MKKVLVMNFFPAFVPPSSGGELRYFNMYNVLSNYFDITLLSPTYAHHKEELIIHSNTFREYRVPKESIHNELHMALDTENIGSEVSALVCALSSSTHNRYHELYLELYSSSDIIVHEFPYMLNYDLFFGLDNKPRIYNSHNLESDLVSQIWNGQNSYKYIDYINDLERRLVHGANLVFATSEDERSLFIKKYDVEPRKIYLAPNGVNLSETQNEEALKNSNQRVSSKSAFFIGSSHPPNIEAVQYIINELAPKCNHIEFLIAGGCCDSFNGSYPNNVHLLGKVDEAKKLELFTTSDIGINPMFSGAGTNLKTLEYLAYGLPMVSTDVGVRGLNLVDGEHYFLASRGDFAETLTKLGDCNDLLLGISERGKEYIESNYSWESIARNVAMEINSLSMEKGRKATLLVLNDFECSNAVSGGEVRVNRLYSHLSDSYNVILLCLNGNSNVKVTSIRPNFTEISIPKTVEHLKEEVQINTQHWISANDIICSYMVKKNEFLVLVSDILQEMADIIVLTHPYMTELINSSTKTVIYESHNCEIELKRALLKEHPKFKKLIGIVEDVETRACEISQGVICVSEEDRNKLKEIIPHGIRNSISIQNGVDLKLNSFFERDYSSIRKIFNGHPVILFIGSSHQPNVEALNYIIEKLALENKHYYFLVIGSVCDSYTKITPNNVVLMGKVDESTKDVLYRISDIAINPIYTGSGSNLKLAEYFSYKLPVVTTTFGARGYNIQTNEHAIICELESFSNEITNLIRDKELKAKLVKNAYNFVQNDVNWLALARKYDDYLRTNFIGDVRKKLVLITYRFTNPPLGGAEVYVMKLLEELNRIGDYEIDILTLDVRDVYHKYHFGLEYTKHTGQRYLEGLQNVKFHYCKVDELSSESMFSNALKLFDMWMEESREVSLKFIEKCSNPMLLGGWHYPEKQEEGYVVWSSDSAYVYLNNAKRVTISGLSPSWKTVSIYSNDDRLLHTKKVYRQFELSVDVGDCHYICIQTEGKSVKEIDPRKLGVQVKSILVESGGENGNFHVPLDYNYRAFLKEHHVEQYIEHLIYAAEHRDPKMDQIFQETRGPLSTEMENWLAEHINDYDIVLGHSVPFHTSVLASKYAKQHGKPCVIIPHFHIEDEFYHWKSYYNALREADGSIVSPNIADKLFYKKIDANAVLTPGGAIDPNEYLHVDSSSFMKKYNLTSPFILVLGRKTASKNYKPVIEAVDYLNNKGIDLKLVMVGKNEDKEPIHSNHTIYLGELDRSEVLGALKESSILVSMSESESFGIVLLEAWMMSKPVIINENCAAFTELVQDGYNGLYANVNNLKNKIEELMVKPHLRNQMGARGKDKVNEQYTWEMVARSINQYLNSIL
ncbi:glycosyltransferase family 4 protein [Paenibacillus popilliae]|uniref:Glycosyltransferase n=1 Tax=Paenibacillus popilliae TaxID=78057 RepID=A0ABY3ALP2_PAEPP|nr:glycosyltransferase family 4 protein [Paenibacillus sp. SDF0028]TQR43695.1 glycosyltransferase [Paenibacillus sp. SDF0028]